MSGKFNLLLIPLNAIWLFASGNILLIWLLTTGAKRTEESLQANAMTGIDYHLIIPASLLAIFGFLAFRSGKYLGSRPITKLLSYFLATSLLMFIFILRGT